MVMTTANFGWNRCGLDAVPACPWEEPVHRS